MKKLKRIRAINAIVWGVLLAVVVFAVISVWSDNGCTWKSLILGALWDGGGCVAIWLLIDQHIREMMKELN